MSCIWYNVHDIQSDFHITDSINGTSKNVRYRKVRYIENRHLSNLWKFLNEDLEYVRNGEGSVFWKVFYGSLTVMYMTCYMYMMFCVFQWVKYLMYYTWCIVYFSEWCMSIMKGVWRIIVGLLVFWLVVILYFNSTLLQTGDLGERTERQLRKALSELDALKVQNGHLYKLAAEIK